MSKFYSAFHKKKLFGYKNCDLFWRIFSWVNFDTN